MRRLSHVLDCLQAPPKAKDRPEFAQDIPREAFGKAAEALASTKESEERESSGQPGYEPPAGRRGGRPVPLDDLAFVSRDEQISVLQSALEEYFLTQEPNLVQPVAVPKGRRRSGTSIIPVADLELVGAPAKLRQTRTSRRVGHPFEIPSDPRWVCCKVAEWMAKKQGRHDFVDDRPPSVEIADDALIILVGDWGTGITRAQAVAKQICKQLEAPKAIKRQRHVVHLGDIYYSGWPFEVEGRFLQYWPVAENEAGTISSWSLNGNHDMYSGGEGYFETLLGNPRFAAQQGSSYFKLYNKNWQILGLDTAYEEGRLAGGQVDWLGKQLDESGGQKTMLLSHHQLFSAYDHQGKELDAQIGPLLEGGRVQAWFWGHEHRCVVYRPWQDIEFASCIGHGGVPVYMWHREGDPYKDPADYEYRKFFRKLPSPEPWALFGFVVLDFAGKRVTVTYVDEFGSTHHQETIS
jgi:hypothetical protein